MSKIFNLSMFVLIGFLTAQVQAKTISLGPNESKSFTSSWQLHANCSIQCAPQAKGKIKISVLKNHGTVNGKSLSTGQATYLNVKNNSNISVSADSGTQVNLINLGSERLQAVCST